MSGNLLIEENPALFGQAFAGTTAPLGHQHSPSSVASCDADSAITDEHLSRMQQHPQDQVRRQRHELQICDLRDNDDDEEAALSQQEEEQQQEAPESSAAETSSHKENSFVEPAVSIMSPKSIRRRAWFVAFVAVVMLVVAIVVAIIAARTTQRQSPPVSNKSNIVGDQNSTSAAETSAPSTPRPLTPTTNEDSSTLSSPVDPTPPPNDDCLNAERLSLENVTVIRGSLVGASEELSELTGVRVCGDASTNRQPGVWYVLEPQPALMQQDGNVTMKLTVSTCTVVDLTSDSVPLADTLLSVLVGSSCGSLQCVDGNDDYCGEQSSVTFEYNVRQYYYILVQGFTGMFHLTVTPSTGETCGGAVLLMLAQEEASKDDMANASEGRKSASVIGSTLSILQSDGTPSLTGSCPFQSTPGGAWYKVVGTGRRMTVTTCSQRKTFRTRHSVFTTGVVSPGSVTCQEETLQCVGEGDVSNVDSRGMAPPCRFAGASTTTLTFETNLGWDYFVQVYGIPMEAGIFELSVREEPLLTCSQSIFLNDEASLTMTAASTLSVWDSPFNMCDRRTLIDSSKTWGSWYAVNGTGEWLAASTCNTALFTNSDFSSYIDTSISVFVYNEDKVVPSMGGGHSSCNNEALQCFGKQNTIHYGSCLDDPKEGKDFNIVGSDDDPLSQRYVIWRTTPGEMYYLWVQGVDRKLGGGDQDKENSTVLELSVYSLDNDVNDNGNINVAALFSTHCDAAEGPLPVIPPSQGTSIYRGWLQLTFERDAPDFFSCGGDSYLDAITSTFSAHRPSRDPHGMWYRVEGTGNVLSVKLVCAKTTFANAFLLVYSSQCRDYNETVASSPPSLSCINANDPSRLLCDSDKNDDNNRVVWNSVAGQEYFVWLIGYDQNYNYEGINDDNAVGVFAFEIESFLPGDNDICTEAVLLVDINSTTMGSTRFARNAPEGLEWCRGTWASTEEFIFDLQDFRSGQRSVSGRGVWYKIVGTGDVFQAWTCYQSMSTQAALTSVHDIFVYTGTTCNELECLEDHIEYSSLSLSSLCEQNGGSVVWQSVADTSYYLLVVQDEQNDRAGTSGGEFELLIQSYPKDSIQIVNECSSAFFEEQWNESALWVGSTLVSSAAATTLATDGSAENSGLYFDGDNIDCGIDTTTIGPTFGGEGVWYRVEGNGNMFAASTCTTSTTFEAQLSVFSPADNTNTCETLKCIAYGKDPSWISSCGGGKGSLVAWNSVVGETYFILVYGNRQQRGVFGLTFRQSGESGSIQNNGNDLCPDATELAVNSSAPAILNDSTVFATFDEVGTCGGAANTGPGVWYYLRGTGDTFVASTCGGDTTSDDTRIPLDTQISVFVGENCDKLDCVTGNDDAAVAGDHRHGCSWVDWQSQRGLVYFILVHSFARDQGDFVLSVTITPQ